MGFATKHRFYGRIDSRQAISFLYGLDYSKSKAVERVECVEEILEEGITHAEYVNDYGEISTDERNWFEKYTDEYYTPTLRCGVTGDALAHENNVFGVLDKLASYILWSEDNKKSEKEQSYKYKYYDDEIKFMRKVRKRESSYEGMTPSEDEGVGEVIHFLTSACKNYKKSKEVTITSSDFDRSECGEVLGEYNSLIETIRREAKETTDYKHKRQIQSLMPEVRADMVISKQQLVGVIDTSSNKLLTDSTDINWEALDIYDKDTVKALIQYCATSNCYDFQEDKQCLIYDFLGLVDRAKKSGRISEANQKVLSLYQTGMVTEQIGKLLNKSKQAVRVNLNTICNAIIKQYEDEIEDWLYTYHRKGEYKTCGECGEVKLSGKFSTQPSNRDGLKSYCKCCEYEKRQKKKRVLDNK